jgi:hypothetical protein
VTSSDPTGGASDWAVTNIDNVDHELSGVSCPTAGLCVAVDRSGQVVVGATPGPAGGKVPVSTIPPGISGTTTEGQALTAVAGTWEGSPTSFSYQWERCNTVGAECQPISGATGQSYTLTAADVGSEIRVQETGVNGEGAGSPAVSDPTRVVQAAASGGGNPPGGGSGTGGGSNPTSGSTATGSTGASAASSAPPSNVPVQPPAKAKPLTEAQKLTKALKACTKEKPKGKRKACEAQAKKRYAPKSKSKHRRGKRGG